MNVLFTSVGRRVSLIRQFRTSKEKLGLEGKLVATDLKKNAPAAFVADSFEQTSKVKSPEYRNEILQICEKHKIDLLIPLIDTELYLLSTWSEYFSEAGVRLVVSSPEVNRMCGDKKLTYDFFRDHNIETPLLYSLDEVINSFDDIYPLIVKPANGSCSIGVHKVNNIEELKFFSQYIENPIIQEFVSGEEYTIDVLVDFSGNVKVAVPRLRLETRAGEISKGVTVKNLDLIEAVQRVINSLPGATGCITVQCFLTPEGKIKFIEINPRFGGGFPLSYEAGADYPGWIMKMVQGDTVNASADSWTDGVVMLRYDDAIFTDRESAM